MSLFRRDTDFTSLFHTREDNRTNLFFTEDAAGVNIEDSTINPSLTINGWNVTISGLEYTYVESGRSGTDSSTVLYYAVGEDLSDVVELVQTYPTATYFGGSIPGTLTLPFTNPDPSPNPLVTSTALNTIPDLTDRYLLAGLWKKSTNEVSPLYNIPRTFSAGANFVDGLIRVKSFNPSTAVLTLEFIVDTTYNNFWYDISVGTTNFDYLSTKFDSITFNAVNGLYSGSYVINDNAGGHTAPFDKKYYINFTDTAPRYAGNFAIYEWTHRVIAYGNLSTFIGNPTFTLVNSGSFSYATNKVATIEDSVIGWIGINSFTLTESEIIVNKSFPEWTTNFTLTHTRGGTTTNYTITGGPTVIDMSTLSPPITPSNNDVFEIIQPVSGPTLSVTYQKSITVAYTGTPPNDWTVTVTTLGINLPVTVDIRDGSNNKIDDFEMTTSTFVFDIRDLPLTPSYGGHTHVDWYGSGTVYFHTSSVNTPFDASYATDPADGSTLSGAMINGYDTTVTNNPYTFTFVGTFEFADGHDFYYNDYDTGTGTKGDLVLDNQTSTTITKTFQQSDFTGAIYTADTPIPAVNRDVKAVLYEPISGTLSPLVSVSKSFDVGETYLKSELTNFFYQAGLLEFRVLITTAKGSIWNLLEEGSFSLEVDSGVLEFHDFTASSSYQLDSQSGTNPRTFNISSGSPYAGTIQVAVIRYRVLSAGDQTDIVSGNWSSLKKNSGTVWATNVSIDVPTVAWFSEEITAITAYDATSFTIQKNISLPFNWSYRINAGSTVPVSGVSGATQTVSGITLTNGDVLEVFQPYYAGVTLTETLSGLPPAALTIQHAYPQYFGHLDRAHSFDFNNDGTKVYTGTSSTLEQYDLDTAYKIDTATNQTTPTTTLTTSLNVSRALHFNHDGTILYVWGNIGNISNSGRILQIPLSTPYDITTAGTEVVLITHSETSTNIFDGQYARAPDGTEYVYAESQNGSYVQQYITYEVQNPFSTKSIAAISPQMVTLFNAYASANGLGISLNKVVAMALTPDGTKAVFGGENSSISPFVHVLFVCELTTPYLLDTNITVTEYKRIANQEQTVMDSMWLKEDLTSMIVSTRTTVVPCNIQYDLQPRAFPDTSAVWKAQETSDVAWYDTINFATTAITHTQTNFIRDFGINGTYTYLLRTLAYGYGTINPSSSISIHSYAVTFRPSGQLMSDPQQVIDDNKIITLQTSGGGGSVLYSVGVEAGGVPVIGQSSTVSNFTTKHVISTTPYVNDWNVVMLTWDATFNVWTCYLNGVNVAQYDYGGATPFSGYVNASNFLRDTNQQSRFDIERAEVFADTLTPTEALAYYNYQLTI